MKFELNGVLLDLDKETVEGMLKKFDIPNNRRFKPEIGDNYWYIDNSGRKNNTPHDMHRFDLARIARNNCYRSEEEAEKADNLQIKIVKLNDMIDEFNGDWVPNWTDETQKKCQLIYNHSVKEPDALAAYTQQGYLLVKYVKSGIDTLPTEIKNLFTEICEAING